MIMHQRVYFIEGGSIYEGIVVGKHESSNRFHMNISPKDLIGLETQYETKTTAVTVAFVDEDGEVATLQMPVDDVVEYEWELKEFIKPLIPKEKEEKQEQEIPF